jgi:hypothetical protein
MQNLKPKATAAIVALLLCSFLSSACLVNGQSDMAPSFQWEQEYYGPGQDGDSVTGLIQTVDGGYAFAGTSAPYSGSGLSESTRVTKTDAEGNLEWQTQYFYPPFHISALKCLGLIQTSDEGFIFGLSDNATSGFDILKLDAEGNTQWNRTYPYNGCSVMTLAPDSGYTFAGTGTSSVWLMKTDLVGNVQWYKTYQATFDRGVTKLVQTREGCYLMIGNSIIDPYFSGSAASLEVLKTDLAGTLLWNKEYNVNSSGLDEHSIIQTNDDNYVIMDNTNSSVRIFKINQNGEVQWTQNYLDMGVINSIVETSDGGLALAGINSNCNSILRIAKTDSSGRLEWSITGGNLEPGPYAQFGIGYLFYNSGYIIESKDGSIVIAGIANNQNAYQASYYLTKTQPFLPQPTSASFSFPNVPSTLPTEIKLPPLISTDDSTVNSTLYLSTIQLLLLLSIITLLIAATGVTLFIVYRKKA